MVNNLVYFLVIYARGVADFRLEAMAVLNGGAKGRSPGIEWVFDLR
ncbi:hypothetical protein I6H52_09705 [Corynebacterium urealyticum]|nr:hypothetical protein [Corynebacterium urealyticum]QQB07693.1 hypothetical protein I6H53_00595 [Corynebacterium urealyticum]QQE50741.1 hypothetical protein I6H52_09705 [Corynebacterium urealyticum]